MRGGNQANVGTRERLLDIATLATTKPPVKAAKSQSGRGSPVGESGLRVWELTLATTKPPVKAAMSQSSRGA